MLKVWCNVEVRILTVKSEAYLDNYYEREKSILGQIIDLLEESYVNQPGSRTQPFGLTGKRWVGN